MADGDGSTAQAQHREIPPIVWIRPFGSLNPNAPRRGPAGGMCITPDWLHFD